jgi:Homeodomain-like domain
MTTNEPAQYWSVTEIGALFGVSGHTVDVWRRRYSPGRAEAEIQKAPAFPEPDIVLGVSRSLAGWSPERPREIREWYASRPGQGAGVGRPRKDASAA